jgi:predicted ATP-dependent endonuclease of OLD family
MLLLKKLEEHFPDRQIIATTHSPVIVSEMDDKYLCDLETFIDRGDRVVNAWSPKTFADGDK